MNREYFSVALSSSIDLALPLENMGSVIQIEQPNICTVPGVADFWYGIVNFKGSLLWVLDSNLYFDLKDSQNIKAKKLTAVIIKQHQNQNSRRIALVTSKLQGIVSLNSTENEAVTGNFPSLLKDCCSDIINSGSKHIFILNSLNLLEQLHQRSNLVSA